MYLNIYNTELKHPVSWEACTYRKELAEKGRKDRRRGGPWRKWHSGRVLKHLDTTEANSASGKGINGTAPANKRVTRWPVKECGTRDLKIQKGSDYERSQKSDYEAASATTEAEWNVARGSKWKPPPPLQAGWVYNSAKGADRMVRTAKSSSACPPAPSDSPELQAQSTCNFPSKAKKKLIFMWNHSIDSVFLPSKSQTNKICMQVQGTLWEGPSLTF